MDATCELVTNHLKIPADAMAHGDVQAAAGIPFNVLDEHRETTTGCFSAEDDQDLRPHGSRYRQAHQRDRPRRTRPAPGR